MLKHVVFLLLAADISTICSSLAHGTRNLIVHLALQSIIFGKVKIIKIYQLRLNSLRIFRNYVPINTIAYNLFATVDK